MQALSVEQYARLQQLSRRYQHCHAEHIRHHPARNPRLTVDMLCFQPLPDAAREPGASHDELIGALITPVSLSLAVVASVPQALSNDMPTRWVVLPGGRYPFVPLALGDDDGLWHCGLLDDLHDLESLNEANRLAQHLLERVLTSDSED